MGRGYSPKPLTRFFNVPRQICHICRRQMSIPPSQNQLRPQRGRQFPLAKFITSAVGRCPFPLAIYGEGVADRPGVRSNRPGVRSNRPGVRSNGPGVRSNRPGVRSSRPGVRSNRLAREIKNYKNEKRPKLNSFDHFLKKTREK